MAWMAVISTAERHQRHQRLRHQHQGDDHRRRAGAHRPDRRLGDRPCGEVRRPRRARAYRLDHRGRPSAAAPGDVLLVLLIGVGISLTFVGAEIQPILTAGILIGVVVVLALRGVAENFAAGLVLQTRRPIQLGDDIDVLDYSGIVREMNSRAVVIEAWDRRRSTSPTAPSSTTWLANWARHTPRRSEVEVRLAVADAFDEAVSAVLETVANVPG